MITVRFAYGLRCMKNTPARSRHFTFLELLAVLALVGLGAALFGIRAYRAQQEIVFQSTVHSVMDRVHLSEELMLTLNTDVKVVFEENSEGTIYHLKVERELSRPAKKLVESKWLLRGLYVSFEDEKTGSSLKSFELCFYAHGGKMSKGILSFTCGEKQISYELPGVPYPLFKHGKTPWQNPVSDDKILYPEEVRLESQKTTRSFT